jgi:hypothetical protein
MQDGQAISIYGTGCFRKQLIGSFGIEEPFPPDIALLGAQNEVRYEEQLKAAGTVYEREVAVKQPILGEAYFSGRIDFWCPEEAVKIRELKSASSENTYKEVIKKGHVKATNLAQVVAYMVCKEEVQGNLIYTYYPGSGEPIERSFSIGINDSGKITVDDGPSGFSVGDYLEHRIRSAVLIQNREVGDKPKDWDNKWKSPCKYCKWASACGAWDLWLLEDVEAFLDKAEQSVKGAK